MGKLAKSFDPCNNAAAISVVSNCKITLARSLSDFSRIIIFIEVCYFDAQQQVFIESVRQDKQEDQETLQEPMQGKHEQMNK